MQLLHRLLDLLLPVACAWCRAPLRASPAPCFCEACWSDLPAMTGPVCPGCGRPFGSPEALSASPEHECGSCRQDPPRFDQALAAGAFEGPLREAVHLFKYRPMRALGRPLAGWMADRVRLVHALDAVVPVPLHRSRLRQRGFNQAVLLGQVVADRFGLPHSFDNLARVRPTRPQVELTGKERTENVRDAFAVSRPAELEGKRLLLLDDVFTTGATLNECSRVLKLAGARSVIAFTLARTVDG